MGLCNPPGGDWSGLSVIVNQCEYSRYHYRVMVNYGKADHVLQLYPYDANSIILSIESKDDLLIWANVKAIKAIYQILVYVHS